MLSEVSESKAGNCALTGVAGRSIKCHIIPEALTETVWQGQPLTQRGRNGNFIRRWTSWYDPRLVTQEGEDILQGYDDWAISFVRANKLVWSSWGPMRRLSSSYMDFYNERLGLGQRTLVDVDTPKLRLFYLSVLWRAAACHLWEFDHIRISEDELEKLREMVCTGNPEPWDFYPLSLIQLCTQTVPFNQALSRLTKREPTHGPDGNPDFINCKSIDFFRIYFDGLIASLNIAEDPQHFAGARQIFVNSDTKVRIMILPSERSAHISRINYERGVPVPPEHLSDLFEINK